MIPCFDQLDKISEMERARFLCNEWGKDFLDDVKLGLHQYAVHTEKPFEKFQNHMRKHKTQKNVSKCELCCWKSEEACQTSYCSETKEVKIYQHMPHEGAFERKCPNFWMYTM